MAINPEDLIDPIRYYKPNDPYYYEVDNLPLEDLLENDRRLLQAITSIVASIPNDLEGGDRFATERWVSKGAAGPWTFRRLEDLANVSTDAPTEKQVLTYTPGGGGFWKPETPATFLDDLEDVHGHAGAGAAPNQGSILQYHGTHWQNLFGAEPEENDMLQYSDGYWRTVPAALDVFRKLSNRDAARFYYEESSTPDDECFIAGNESRTSFRSPDWNGYINFVNQNIHALDQNKDLDLYEIISKAGLKNYKFTADLVLLIQWQAVNAGASYQRINQRVASITMTIPEGQASNYATANFMSTSENTKLWQNVVWLYRDIFQNSSDNWAFMSYGPERPSLSINTECGRTKMSTNSGAWKGPDTGWENDLEPDHASPPGMSTEISVPIFWGGTDHPTTTDVVNISTSNIVATKDSSGWGMLARMYPHFLLNNISIVG